MRRHYADSPHGAEPDGFAAHIWSVTTLIPPDRTTRLRMVRTTDKGTVSLMRSNDAGRGPVITAGMHSRVATRPSRGRAIAEGRTTIHTTTLSGGCVHPYG